MGVNETDKSLIQIENDVYEANKACKLPTLAQKPGYLASKFNLAYDPIYIASHGLPTETLNRC